MYATVVRIGEDCTTVFMHSTTDREGVCNSSHILKWMGKESCYGLGLCCTVN